MHILNKFTPLSFITKVILLLCILTITFILRISTNNTLPIDHRHNYSQHYLHAVSYAVGGLDYKKLDINPDAYLLAGIDHDTVGKSTVQAFDDFLSSKVDKLDILSITPYITHNTHIFDRLSNLTYDPFGQYVAAIVWKLFGVSWSNLFYFYALLSSFAGFCLFLLGRKMTSSYWGGIFTLIAYSVAVPEIYGSAWSIRDASPVWFFAFAVTFYFVFTHIYKKEWLNYLSYYMLGIVTLLGVGWRSDALLFFPFIAFFLSIDFVKQYKDKKSSFKKLFMFFVLFMVGSYSVLTLNSKLTAPSAPLGFMHIALYAEKNRSDIGQYENNFQILMNDYQTMWQVQHYQKQTYPQRPPVELMKGDYGKYCSQLYLKVLEHNIYQWVKTYPQYLVNTFIRQDIITSAYQYRQKHYQVLENLWTSVLYIAILGSLFFLFIGFLRYEISFFLLFIVYYSVIYWSMLPMQKHIMLMSVPVSVLFGIALFFMLKTFLSYTFFTEILEKLKSKRNMIQTIAVIFILFFLYYLILYVSMQYSIKTKNTYINQINQLEKYAKDISPSMLIQNKNKFTIDASQRKAIGLFVQFTTTGKEGLVKVRDTYSHWGQTRPITYQYKVSKNIKKHRLFTTLMGFNIKGKYLISIQFPLGAIIQSIKVASLDTWEEGSYGSVFSDNEVIPGAKSLRVRNDIKYELLKKTPQSILIKEVVSQSFVPSSYQKEQNQIIVEDKDKQSIFWTSTSRKDILLLSREKFVLNQISQKTNAVSIIFKKYKPILDQNLYIRLQLLDEKNIVQYTTPLRHIGKDSILSNTTIEVTFDISQKVLKSTKFRIYFYAKQPGTYVIPKNIKIFQNL